MFFSQFVLGIMDKFFLVWMFMMPHQKASSYCGWDHIAMVCENWIFQFILDPTGNNILGTLIYIHTQLFMNINAMVWISTF
jgi:hypothetical protein